MARVTYNLTIVATVFLPLTFMTGLLGINVGGIPESHNPWGFWTVCIVLTVFAVISWVIIRWRRLI
jgi:zinc transporter